MTKSATYDFLVDLKPDVATALTFRGLLYSGDIYLFCSRSNGSGDMVVTSITGFCFNIAVLPVDIFYLFNDFLDSFDALVSSL